jgi:hypothetical protein
MPASPTRAVLAAILLTALTTPRGLTAQLPPPTIPKGLLRLDGFAELATWNRRFHDGQDQPLAQDFIRDSLGSDFFPALTGADALLQRVTGLATARLNLGASRATQMVMRGLSGLGLGYGLTSRLTIFGRVPIVRVKVRASLALDSTESRAGFNPADPVFGDGFGAAQSAAFFGQLDDALEQLQDNLAGGVYDGDPTTKALAEQTLAQGTALRGDLYALILGPGTASPFLPTRASAEGVALLARITALQATLRDALSISGFSETPALPAQRLSDEGFRSFLTRADGPVAGALEAARPVLAAIGDIEVGAAYTLVDHVNESERASGLRVTAQGLVRLPTGPLDRSDVFFDVGIGDRQPDVDLSLLTDAVLPWGGARLEGGYNLQLARAVRRRIAPPSVPTPYAITDAAVSRNPGDVWSAAIRPYLRLAPTFALVGGIRYSRKGTDQVTLVAGEDEVPDAPASLLAEDTEVAWVEWSAGVSYRSPLGQRRGRRRMPLDAGLTLTGVSAASGGRVSNPFAIRSFIRLYAPFL